MFKLKNKLKIHSTRAGLVLLSASFLLVLALPASVSANDTQREIERLCQDQGIVSPDVYAGCVDSVINQQISSQCNRNSADRYSECATRINQEARPSPVTQDDFSAGDLQADCNEDVLTPENCGIIAYIRLFTDALSVLVGIVVVMMIVIGGIQYSSAGNNPQAVAGAKKRISQALFALVAYIFMFAFLQWIVPGGVF
jgi:hypothetical protein